jgi:SpoVK/Ycf46/Vps4 family AAA+-type ATPase
MKINPLTTDLPISEMTTDLEWTDLLLDHIVMEQVEEISTWIKYQDPLMEDRKRNKHGNLDLVVLFYGPNEADKKFTAVLLGKKNSLPVYHVDLGKVISKYIGETEKNLAKIFDKIANSKCILFFDEADALFGKRPEDQTTQYRAANQQIAYFLQRIEELPGLVILAANLLSAIDESFARRFQYVIQFGLSGAK